MSARARAQMRRLILLVLIAGGGILAWQKRDEIERGWDELRRWGSTPDEPSPALAEAAHAKLADLGQAGGSQTVSLSEAEVQSLLLYRFASALPPFITTPEVEFGDDQLRIQARVPTDQIPWTDEAREVRELLPDTTLVAAKARFLPLDGGRVALAVNELSAARVPLPRTMIPTVLDRLGRENEPGLPPHALPVPLPTGVDDVYIRSDRLVIVPRRPVDP